MNNKGITLITVVVMIIIIIIIATTSIIAGNKLVLNARNLTDSQVEETIREAMSRRRGEIDLQGTITPKGDSYPGKVDPLIGEGTYNAKGWYLLVDEDLTNLGVKDAPASSRFLVNYKYLEVLDMSDRLYLEKYFVCTFLHKVYDKAGSPSEYIGERLANKTDSGDTSRKMYVDHTENNPDYYGTGWYVITPAQVIDKLQEDFLNVELNKIIKNSYLINYDKSKYTQITSKFEEI